MKKRDKGPVEILCDEIGFRFDPRYERPEILLSFVSVLVEHVAHRVSMNKKIVEALGGKPYPSEFDRVLSLMRATIRSDDPITNAALTHDLVHEVNPEGGPCDHDIDMLSSCASAVRFGLEYPCHSRHAAAAASHVWKRIYGISLFDQFTPEWCNDWSRAQFQEAIFRLINTSDKDQGGDA